VGDAERKGGEVGHKPDVHKRKIVAFCESVWKSDYLVLRLSCPQTSESQNMLRFGYFYALYDPDVRGGGGVSSKRTMLDKGGGHKSQFWSDVFDG